MFHGINDPDILMTDALIAPRVGWEKEEEEDEEEGEKTSLMRTI